MYLKSLLRIKYLLLILFISVLFLSTCKTKKTQSYSLQNWNLDYHKDFEQIEQVAILMENSINLSPNKKKESIFLSVSNFIKNKNLLSYQDSTQFISELAILMAEASVIYANLNPDNFDIQVQTSSSLVMHLGALITDDSLIINKQKKICIDFANNLVIKYPEKGTSYGQLAFVSFITNSASKEECKTLYKKCIELDKDASFCREGLDALSK